MPGSTHAVAQIIEPIVVRHGCDLEGLVVRSAGKRRLVQVLVDRDGGVTLDEIAAISREVSAALDAADALGTGAYLLDVGSPGLDRPLTLPRHWRRNVGRLVRISDSAGAVRTGRILSAGEDVVTMDVDGQEQKVPLAEVARAVVQVEFRSVDEDDADDQSPGSTGDPINEAQEEDR